MHCLWQISKIVTIYFLLKSLQYLKMELNKEQESKTDEPIKCTF